MIIAIDFDGTIVKHEYPKIGVPVPDAVRVIKRLQKICRIILLTMRSGDELKQAVQYCEDNGIILWSVNSNPEQKSWTESEKVYANFYIDDASIGCPLVRDHHRPYVDWPKVELIFHEVGLI